jgi:hypothetical protein
MNKLPHVIVSSVIRSTHQGESHGGIYVVDLEKETFRMVVDWNEGSIDWEGRGGDRGLRGIAFHGDDVYIAASDEIFIFDKQFSIQRSIRNKYLKHCHEIHIHRDMLYASSTGYDSILVFDIQVQKWSCGYCLRHGSVKRHLMEKLNIGKPRLWVFDPESDEGPEFGDTWHINHVYTEGDVIYLSGTGLGKIFTIVNEKVQTFARIPFGTHNSRPFRDGVLVNHTQAESIRYLSRSGKVRASFPVRLYDENQLLKTNLSRDHARQGFARGLCLFGDDIIIGGSSPATVSVYSVARSAATKTINLTMDIRNAVHGLEVWPYS